MAGQILIIERKQQSYQCIIVELRVGGLPNNFIQPGHHICLVLSNLSLNLNLSRPQIKMQKLFSHAASFRLADAPEKDSLILKILQIHVDPDFSITSSEALQPILKANLRTLLSILVPGFVFLFHTYFRRLANMRRNSNPPIHHLSICVISLPMRPRPLTL